MLVAKWFGRRSAAPFYIGTAGAPCAGSVRGREGGGSSGLVDRGGVETCLSPGDGVWSGAGVGVQLSGQERVRSRRPVRCSTIYWQRAAPGEGEQRQPTRG
jgi:hypothetical protein